jgi:hypothetical protein
VSIDGKVPEPGRADHVYDAADIALIGTVGLVPFVGPALAKVFEVAVQRPVAKRQTEFLKELLAETQRLAASVAAFAPDRLASNETFVSAVALAVRAASYTQHDDKRTALRNVVLNTARLVDPDEDLVFMFLRFIDELTPIHLRLLDYLADPYGWFDREGIRRPDISSGPRMAALQAALPNIADRPVVMDQALSELDTRGLITKSMLSGVVTANSIFSTVLTDLGREFLGFVRAPEITSETDVS